MARTSRRSSEDARRMPSFCRFVRTTSKGVFSAAPRVPAAKPPAAFPRLSAPGASPSAPLHPRSSGPSAQTYGANHAACRSCTPCQPISGAAQLRAQSCFSTRAMEFPNRFCSSSCSAIFAFSSGVMVSTAGTVASTPARHLLPTVPCDTGRPVSRWCSNGMQKNCTQRIHVPRTTSGSTPCRARPTTPCAATKRCTSTSVESMEPPADAMRSARTTSTGYMAPAVRRQPPAIGPSVSASGAMAAGRPAWEPLREPL
mmetsp:Transcript_5773/g.15551  ORF Transcript_5773/g.15551 Transcript_5773/m.15551 type:complete len:257 (+) Transcript_5773:191-961(+)